MYQWCLFIIRNRWKFQCGDADNKAYRAMQSLYANCMGKSKTRWLSSGSLYVNIKEKRRVQLSQNFWFLAHLSRRLRGELLVYQWLRCPSSVVRPSVNIFKHLLLWNHWANLTQISYGDSLGWENESLFKCSWSHDQDGRHAHIW